MTGASQAKGRGFEIGDRVLLADGTSRKGEITSIQPRTCHIKLDNGVHTRLAHELLLPILSATERERDELIVARDTFKQVAHFHARKAREAESALAAAREALEKIARGNEPRTHEEVAAEALARLSAAERNKEET